ncbi:MAG: sulfatase-like hydrolase/transferase [Bacteroidota bacterium]
MIAFKPRFKTISQQIILLFVVYEICRLFFYLFNRSAFQEISVSELASLFIYGLRFDAFSICALSSVFVLLFMLPFRFVQTKTYQVLLDVFFIVPNTVGILLNFIDFAYFPFNHNRSNYNVIRFVFNGETEFSKLLPEFLSEFWYIILLFIVLEYAFIKIYFIIKNRLKYQQQEFSIKTLSQALGLFVLFNALTVLGIRGGLQRAPIVILDAAAYTAPSNIPLVVNTPFFILKTAELSAIEALQLMPKAEEEKWVNPIHLPDENNTAFKPMNVCVLILESFSKEFTKIGNRRSFTPFLDSLMDVSVLFKNGIANGKTSLEGIPSVVASIPSYMVNPYINSMYSNNNITSLANVLKTKQYSSTFYHGGTNGTMNFNVFAKAAGYDRYFGRSEYNNDADYDGQWGIWDEPFLQRCIQEINAQKKPFFSTIFTLSSHNPYKVPEKYRDKFPKGIYEINEAIGYADYSLRKFFASAQKETWFKNTLFVISPDHTASSEDNFYKHQFGQFTIPILFYQSGIQPKLVEKTVQQIDIMPSILKYLNYDKAYYSLGHNMFDSIAKPCVYFLNPVYYCINDSTVYTMNNYRFNAKYNYRLDSGLIRPLPVESRDKSIETYCRALVQRYNNDLIKDKIQVKNP